ncbi:MAG: trypsin-like peptidase domain-containing protein [Bacteroidetes bacterium]|nr:trypsin-like peptidase domain-containing protein [Bacteroidota bacterium]
MTATGTGFAVSQSGIICTNFHVIQGSKKIYVYIDGLKVRAQVLVADESADLALLKIDKNNLINKPIPYKFDDYNPIIGENVFVLGFPSSNILGQDIKLTNGIVSSSKGFKDDNSTFQISAPIQPGNSGSPLFNDKGNLIGIINSGVPSMENVGYSIKMKHLLNLMKKIPSFPFSNRK